jgi:hypothetical protein
MIPIKVKVHYLVARIATGQCPERKIFKINPSFCPQRHIEIDITIFNQNIKAKNV